MEGNIAIRQFKYKTHIKVTQTDKGTKISANNGQFQNNIHYLF